MSLYLTKHRTKRAIDNGRKTKDAKKLRGATQPKRGLPDPFAASPFKRSETVQKPYFLKKLDDLLDLSKLFPNHRPPPPGPGHLPPHYYDHLKPAEEEVPEENALTDEDDDDDESSDQYQSDRRVGPSKNYDSFGRRTSPSKNSKNYDSSERKSSPSKSKNYDSSSDSSEKEISPSKSKVKPDGPTFRQPERPYLPPFLKPPTEEKRTDVENEKFFDENSSAGEEEEITPTPKIARQMSNHMAPFKTFQHNIIHESPFFKRPNIDLDHMRQLLPTRTPVEQPTLSNDRPPSQHINEIIDQHSFPTDPDEYNDHGEKMCPCGQCKKCDATCSCAEPYKQALWNFVQCMQACIESVLTEIDKIRVKSPIRSADFSGGKFPRSSGNEPPAAEIEAIQKLIESYKTKLAQFNLTLAQNFTDQAAPATNEIVQLQDVDSSQDNDDDGSEEESGADLKEFLDNFMAKLNIDAVDPAESLEVDENLMKQLEPFEPCDFTPFLQSMVEKLKSQEISFEDVRQLSLANLKRCMNASKSDLEAD